MDYYNKNQRTENIAYPLDQLHGNPSNHRGSYHHHDTDLNQPQSSNNAFSRPSMPLQQQNNEMTIRDEDAQGAEQTTTMVELSISCLNLPDCDIVTKSDPQVITYLLDVTGKDKKCEIGRTEVIQDSLNPKFAKKVLMQYHFEQIQRLRFEVYDIDPVGNNDFLGALNTTLADIVAARSSTFKQPLIGGPRRKPGYLIVEAEELTACKQVATFNLSASNLPPFCCGFFNPSASVHIFRSNESGSSTIVHRSPTVNRTTNPNFKLFQLKLVTLCNGDLDRTIKFELMDQRFRREKALGFFETTINSLKGNRLLKQGQMFNLLHDRGHGGSASVESSTVTISNFRLITQATFLDYIKAGAQIHFVIAIDFTASNGDPAYPDSLHYLDPMGRKMNPYEAALLAVGNIIKPYDTMGLFAGFGFGAKLNGPNKPPSHLFPLNDNDQHPYVSSIEDLLKVYRTKLRNVILSGPTNFAPCIAHCNNIAQQFEDGNHYFVLLIVTDGIISDMMQTKKAIIEASLGPLSIIICGVGDAEFSAMNELDSDDIVMTVDGKSAQRDIVQFVPMNQYMPSGRGSQLGSSEASRRLLAEEVLREIPDQLTGYMVSHGFHSDLTYTCD